MRISVKDGSEYFRGLLLLISRDRKITDPETILMKRIGKALGLEREFCANAIQEILENQFVATAPPRFSSEELAKKFIRDGLTLAGADHNPSGPEEAWLRSTAEQNGVAMEWFHQETESASRRTPDLDARLEVDDLTVVYSRLVPER